MAKQLLSSSIAAPAFYGLNTQESGVTLQNGFALHADNCIIDKQGRLSARKGWVTQTLKANGVVGDNIDIDLLGISDFIDITGAATRLSWSANKFYKGTADLVEQIPTLPAGVSLTEGNWQAATLNDHQYFFQRGYEPLIYTNESGSTEFQSFSEHAHSTAGYPSANTVLAAYGRLWAADTVTNKTTVYFTNVLEGHNFSTGTAGTLDISSVLTQGMDEIVSLGAHNGYLIIFCKNSIIIYGDGDNFQQGMTTSSLTLVEVIEGVGCIARDSVEHTGEDILFLSNTGVRSLNRTVQEKSQPLKDISKNIRNDIIQALESEDVNLVKAVYSPNNAMYLLMMPTSRQTFCFDTRSAMEDGSFRVTVWPSFLPKCFLSNGADIFLATPNGIAKYEGYQDNGVPYQMSYYSNYFDLDVPNVNKMVKKLTATTVGATGQSFALKIGYDYSPIFYSQAFTLTGGVIFEYGVAEYNIAEYAGSILINDQSSPAAGSGSILQVGFTAMINDSPLSLQKLSIYAKQGKVL